MSRIIDQRIGFINAAIWLPSGDMQTKRVAVGGGGGEVR